MTDRRAAVGYCETHVVDLIKHAQSNTFSGDSRTDNRILGSLGQTDRRLLWASMESVSLARGTVVELSREPTAYAYFPVQAVLSLFGTIGDGCKVEVGMIGQEGYLGMPILSGHNAHRCHATVQHGGTAWRIPAQLLEQAFHVSEGLRRHLLGYAGICVMQFTQTAVCHRFHSLEQRLCRWLLAMHDRSGLAEIRLTHEELAQAIGGRRPTINAITNNLKRAGAVASRRGFAIILHRQELERRACECYGILSMHIRDTPPAPLPVPPPDQPVFEPGFDMVR